MTNRIIKSLDCRKIISIFCILEVDFAISVITLFVIFNKPFQKTLVNKSVCVINIVHLIVLPAIKNPLFDVYFNRITALLTVSFLSVMGAYLRPSTIFALIFLPVMPTYFRPSLLVVVVVVVVVIVVVVVVEVVIVIVYSSSSSSNIVLLLLLYIVSSSSTVLLSLLYIVSSSSSTVLLLLLLLFSKIALVIIENGVR